MTPLEVRLTPLEVEVCQELQRRTGHRTLEAVVRAALWGFARHLEVDVPWWLFDQDLEVSAAEGRRKKFGGPPAP